MGAENFSIVGIESDRNRQRDVGQHARLKFRHSVFFEREGACSRCLLLLCSASLRAAQIEEEVPVMFAISRDGECRTGEQL
jgi:hypothetical protein